MRSTTAPAGDTRTGWDAGLDVMVTTVASDAHTWNLVYVQLLLECLGHRVVNLGACVPDDVLLSECTRVRPDLVVVSSVNGHGFTDGLRLIRRFRAEHGIPVVIGGKLGISGPGGPERTALLLAAGFDLVIEDGAGTDVFEEFLDRLSATVRT